MRQDTKILIKSWMHSQQAMSNIPVSLYISNSLRVQGGDVEDFYELSGPKTDIVNVLDFLNHSVVDNNTVQDHKSYQDIKAFRKDVHKLKSMVLSERDEYIYDKMTIRANYNTAVLSWLLCKNFDYKVNLPHLNTR